MTPPDGNIRQLGDAEILVVRGRAYAFGCRWTSATARSTLAREAQAAAAAEDANYVVHHSVQNQFGLARLSATGNLLRRWLFQPQSGAAAIAKAVRTAALAAFPLEDGRWIVLAFDRKGILPDGDVLLADEVAAQERIVALLQQSPSVWRKRFVPEHWGVSESRHVHPADLLQGIRAPRLKALSLLKNRSRLRAAGLISALALSAVGLFYFTRVSVPPPAPLVSTLPPKPAAAVWSPAPLSLDQCLTELAGAERVRAVAGWLPNKFTCLPGKSLFIDFTRTGSGQISTIIDMLPAAQLSDDGRSATLSLALDPLPEISSIGPFDPDTRYRLVGLDLEQRLNGSFTIQPVRKPLPGESNAAPPAPWTQLTWSYRTSAPPPVWAPALSRFGAIEIESLVHAPGDNLWFISGSLYAHP